MKKTLKMSLVALSLAASVASAADAELVIAAGKEGGGYDRAAHTMAERLGQRGYDVEVLNLNGSDEITLKVCGGEAQVGITQVDAMDARAAEGCDLRPVGVYGDGEVALLLFPPKSSLNELSDLTGEHAVLVDTIGSGTSLFWDTIRRIENGPDGNQSEWSKARAVNDPMNMAEPLSSFGDIDAVIMVRLPDSRDISVLLERGWSLGELWDKDLNDYEFNGEPLYASEKISVRAGGKRYKEWGYHVRSFIVVTQATSRDRQVFSHIAGAAQ